GDRRHGRADRRPRGAPARCAGDRACGGDRPSTGGAVSVTADPREAVAGTTAVLTDTWVSMGQEGEDGRGEETFAPYQVTQELMDLSGGLFLHCLPAYRGKEV